jgi:phage terminase small subunit
MKGGHNKLPDAIKEIRGTAQKIRLNPKAPKLRRARVPSPPAGLSRAERAMWRELTPQVEALGIYTVAHYTAFRLLVRMVAEAMNPDLADHARVRVQQAASALLQRFGLDPASIGRVTAVETEADDDAEGFLFGERRLSVVKGGTESR